MVIVVEVQRTRTDRRLAVFDKTGGACLLRQNPNGHSQGQGGLFHASLLSFSNSFVYLWFWIERPESADARLAPDGD
jgi:hypothetical protein